jgi:single-strand DNA-binding protein
VVWRELADRAEKQLKKGMMVYVEGKISYRKYSGQDGVERNVTDIVANTLRLLEKLESNGSDSRFPNTEQQPARAAASSMPADAPPPAAEGDDLPF